jgi:protein-S-isoprenylcysteine O-methyltransferase Ste14
MGEQWNEPNMMTPPTEGGGLLEERRTTWPTVVGVFGVIWASLGLLCSCFGFFAVPFQRWGVEMQAKAGQPTAVAEAQLHVAEQFQVVMIGLIAIGMIFAFILLLGSIALLRRRRSARKKMMIWAMASLLLLALNIAMQVMMFQATVAELNRVGEQNQVGQLWLSAIITGAFAFVFGLGPTLFVLIWFSRQRIKGEVEQWP